MTAKLFGFLHFGQALAAKRCAAGTGLRGMQKSWNTPWCRVATSPDSVRKIKYRLLHIIRRLPCAIPD